MTTAMLRRLLWKEWREQAWKAAFGCVIVGGYAAVGLRTRIVQDSVILGSAAALSVMLMPLLVAMGLTATERQERTLPVLLGLPVTPARVLAVKLAVGAADVLAPIVVLWLVTMIIAGAREVPAGQQSLIFLGTAWASVATLVWMAGCSAGQATEPRASLACLAVFGLWIVIVFLMDMFGGWVERAMFCATPIAGFVWLTDTHGRLRVSGWEVLGAQLLTCAALWAWAAWRLGRAERGRS